MVRVLYFVWAIFLVAILTGCDYSEKIQAEAQSDEAKLEIGDIIQFGNYYWQVLEINNDTLFIISKNVIGSST